MIRKALVDLQGAPFAHFAAVRAGWGAGDDVRSPGPIQARAGAARLHPLAMMLHVPRARDRPADVCRSPPCMLCSRAQFQGHAMADVATLTLALEVNEGRPILCCLSD